MRRTHRPLALGAVVAALAAGPALAQESLTQSFPFQPGQKLEIQTARGSIDYRSGSAGKVTVTVRVDTGKIADYVILKFTPGPAGLRVEGEKVGGAAEGLLSWVFGGGDGPDPNLRFEVDGPARLDADLATADGDLTLPDVEGQVTLATAGGDLRFGTVTGTMTAATAGGDVSGIHVTGEAVIATSGGDISVDLGGTRLEARTSGGDVEVDGAEGPLDLATSGGKIRIGSAAAAVNARTSGGEIRVGRVEGTLDLASSGGSVRVERAGGNAEVATTGGELVIEGAAGRVEAHSSGGAVLVTLAPGNAEGGSIGSSGGLLTVRIPPGLGLNIDADARGGRVTSGLSFTRSTAERQDRLTATLGGGGNVLTLRSDKGDIRIEGTSKN